MKYAMAAVVVAVSACGPAWSGKVSGYTLDVREALFTNLTDSKGSSFGGMIVLSDQTSTCPALAAAKAPPNASLAVFTFVRQADGKLLSPDVGEYIVTNGSTTAAAASTGVFIHTDANGTNAIPQAARVTSSGLLKITDLQAERGAVSGSFEGKFGAQNDTVTVAIHTSPCVIDTGSVSKGFLGKELSFGTVHENVSQSPQCSQMISCYRATYGAMSQLEATYGQGGTCWATTQAAADQCSIACTNALVSVRSSGSAASVCFN